MMCIMKRRRRIETIFRDFIVSCFLGFITGFITTQTLTMFLWQRYSFACKFPYLKNQNQRDVIGRFHKLYSESTNRKLLFVGVMTTRKNLKEKATAIFKTWGHGVPGRLVFFVGSGERIVSPLPVIELNDVADDVYPPREKSFAMLKHIYQNHGNYFEWFMRTDDDLFIQTDLLERFLSSIDSNKDLYMGHPGTGKADEEGHLGLENNEPYCMGGPGVIFSRSTLRKLTENLQECLNKTVSAHEDSELGRCVRRHVGLSCTSSKEFGHLFHQNYHDKTGQWTNHLNQLNLQSLTFHPVKNVEYMYNLNMQLLGRKLRQLQVKEKHYKSVVVTLENNVNVLAGVHVEESQNNCTTVPCDLDSGQPWECIYRYDVYSLNSDFMKESVLNAGRVMSLANARHALYNYVRQRHYRQRLRLVKTAYQRLSPDIGLEHVITAQDNQLRMYSFRTVEVFDPAQVREVKV